MDRILLFIHLSMDMWVVSTLGIYDDEFCVEQSCTGFLCGLSPFLFSLIFRFLASVSFFLHISLSQSLMFPFVHFHLCLLLSVSLGLAWKEESSPSPSFSPHSPTAFYEALAAVP